MLQAGDDFSVINRTKVEQYWSTVITVSEVDPDDNIVFIERKNRALLRFFAPGFYVANEELHTVEDSAITSV